MDGELIVEDTPEGGTTAVVSLSVANDVESPMSSEAMS